eukprot:gnl/MRDRNA2_/MRDRNA2_23099_c0_seq1.p1 gnl/MRDRNA2_/MRDRNA2_23099_c0~~gnl/MRDRNA2_/MRDRNA2_23099_c0_seq1.p1  ORF type:complete len:497 (+),score=75.61 gnl/MRDRNA2_/MRDRNA2_23099_c0_seq1:233-1723(+)
MNVIDHTNPQSLGRFFLAGFGFLLVWSPFVLVLLAFSFYFLLEIGASSSIPSVPIMRSKTEIRCELSGLEKSREKHSTKLEEKFEYSSKPKPGKILGLFPGFEEQALEAGFDAENFLDKGWPKRNDQVTKYLELLIENRRQVPLVPEAVVQRPVPLESPPRCNESHFFEGPRECPAWIVVILTLAWELDLLEMQLYELFDVVDEFVVYEGTHTQRGARKPLVFEREKERFKKFLPKIRHYVQAEGRWTNEKFEEKIEAARGTNVWTNENIRQRAFDRYRKEQEEAGLTLENVLFVNADLDEFAPANGLQRFKFCKTKHSMKMHNFCSITYQPDAYSIEVQAQSCGNLGPYYWKYPNILKNDYPRLRSIHQQIPPYDEFVGTHLHVRDPWSAIAKTLGTAELGYFGRKKQSNGSVGIFGFEPHEILNPGQVYEYIICTLAEGVNGNTKSADRKSIRMPASEFKHPKPLPWFLLANKARFPYAWPREFNTYKFDCNKQ